MINNSIGENKLKKLFKEAREISFISNPGPKQLWNFEIEFQDHNIEHIEVYGTWQEIMDKIRKKYDFSKILNIREI